MCAYVYVSMYTCSVCVLTFMSAYLWYECMHFLCMVQGGMCSEICAFVCLRACVHMYVYICIRRLCAVYMCMCERVRVLRICAYMYASCRYVLCACAYLRLRAFIVMDARMRICAWISCVRLCVCACMCLCLPVACAYVFGMHVCICICAYMCLHVPVCAHVRICV